MRTSSVAKYLVSAREKESEREFGVHKRTHARTHAHKYFHRISAPGTGTETQWKSVLDVIWDFNKLLLPRVMHVLLMPNCQIKITRKYHIAIQALLERKRFTQWQRMKLLLMLNFHPLILFCARLLFSSFFVPSTHIYDILDLVCNV